MFISANAAVKARFEWMASYQKELKNEALGDAKCWGASFAS